MAEETRVFVKCPARKKRYKLVFQSLPNKINTEKIKRHLVGPTSSAIEKQHLYFNGRELENDEFGDQFGLQNDCVITLEIDDGTAPPPPSSPPARTQSPALPPASPRYESRPPLPPARASSTEGRQPNRTMSPAHPESRSTPSHHPPERTSSPDRSQSPVPTLSHCRLSVLKATGLTEAGVSGPVAIGVRGGNGPWVYTGEAMSDQVVKYDEQISVSDASGNAARLKIVVRKTEGAVAFGTFNLQQTNGDVFQSVINMYGDRRKTQPLPIRIYISYNTNASKSPTPLPENTRVSAPPPATMAPSPASFPSPPTVSPAAPYPPASAFSMPVMRFDAAVAPHSSYPSRTAELLIERVYGLVNLPPGALVSVCLKNGTSITSTPLKNVSQTEWNELCQLPLQIGTDEVYLECIIYKSDGSELARGAASLNLRFPNASVNLNCFIADGMGNFYPNGVVILRYRGCTALPVAASTLPLFTPAHNGTSFMPSRPLPSPSIASPFVPSNTPAFGRPPSPPHLGLGTPYSQLPVRVQNEGFLPRPSSPVRAIPLAAAHQMDIQTTLFNGYINVRIHRITSIEGTSLSDLIFPGSIYIGIRNVGEQWRYSPAKLASTVDWGEEVKIPASDRGTLEVSIMQAGSDVCMAQGTFQMQGADSHSITAALLFGPNAHSGLWDLPRALVQLTYRTFTGPIREALPTVPLPTTSPSLVRGAASPMKQPVTADEADIDFATRIEQERLELVKKLQSLNEKTQSHINHISQSRDMTLLKLKQYEEQLERLHMDNEQVQTDILDIEKRFSERRYASPYRSTSPSVGKSPIRALDAVSPRQLSVAVHQLLEEREILNTENEILRSEHQKLMTDVDREMEYHRERITRAQNIELQLEKSKVQFLEQLLQMQRQTSFPLPTPPMPFVHDTSLRMG